LPSQLWPSISAAHRTNTNQIKVCFALVHDDVQVLLGQVEVAGAELEDGALLSIL
jgi:hypothetical protein